RERRWVSASYCAARALMTFGPLAAGLAPNVYISAAGMGLGGCGNGVAIVCNSLIVQRGAPDHLRGRAFTTIMSVNFALLGFGMALAGPITAAVGARWTYALAAVLSGLAAVVARGMTRRLGSLAAPERVATAAS